jgi:hypothetical protein
MSAAIEIVGYLQLMEFALALQNALAFFNQDLLNFDFVCKLGLNIGPVTAGVIGTTKLYYDIWGDTVGVFTNFGRREIHILVDLSHV